MRIQRKRFLAILKRADAWSNGPTTGVRPTQASHAVRTATARMAGGSTSGDLRNSIGRALVRAILTGGTP